MVLRPAKLFSPLHQLRKYLESKVFELVQPTPPFQIARTRIYHSAPQSQSVATHVYQQYLNKAAPSLLHVAEREQQRLLRAIQQQFPIVKVFSSPAIVRPAYQFSFAKSISQASQQQFRTIVSSGATGTSSSSVASTLAGGGGFGGQAAATEGFGFCAGGGFFPRTPMVGYARTPFAARQFSTARSPCVTLFQQSTSTTTANTNGISHISSRLFSPAGSKMYVPTANESNALAAPSPTALDDEHQEHKHKPTSIPLGSRQAKLDSMTSTKGEDQQQQKHQQQQQSQGPVRGPKERNNKRRHHHSARRAHYDYIRHDDLSYRYTPGPQKKPLSHTRHAHWQSSHLKAPPAVVYLSFKLNGASIWHNQRHLHDSQQLDASFIGSLHSIAELYQMFLAEVVALLNVLQRHGKFEIDIAGGHELRVIFPLSHQWPAEDRMAIACRWLSEIGIDPDNPCFSIQEMDPPSLPPNNMSSSSAQEDLENDVFGPEYFKGIQAFLDQVDQLIETGPAFVRG